MTLPQQCINAKLGNGVFSEDEDVVTTSQLSNVVMNPLTRVTTSVASSQQSLQYLVMTSHLAELHQVDRV